MHETTAEAHVKITKGEETYIKVTYICKDPPQHVGVMSDPVKVNIDMHIQSEAVNDGAMNDRNAICHALMCDAMACAMTFKVPVHIRCNHFGHMEHLASEFVHRSPITPTIELVDIFEKKAAEQN